ncbi:MAG: type II toxin-antitoxin system Phd/YefM family antitoxin [Erysipelotrichaceae bacterium]|nr:type II toxin-antitoxin system Phd/YefM family antitoxin [Erysipelotrichaceae bacterium]
MTIVKQMEIRDNIKKYFDIAYSGEPVIVPRKDNKNVVIISEDAFKEYERYKNNIEYLKMLDSSIRQAKEGKTTITDLHDLLKYE